MSLIHAGFTVLRPVRRQWWRITRPVTVGARALILNDRDEVLLVRHRGSTSWYLPGGGTKANESLVDAARREVCEETGVILDTEPERMLGLYFNFSEVKSDHIAVFVFHTGETATPTSTEVDQAAFFPLNDLPASISPGTLRRLNELVGNAPHITDW